MFNKILKNKYSNIENNLLVTSLTCHWPVTDPLTNTSDPLIWSIFGLLWSDGWQDKLFLTTPNWGVYCDGVVREGDQLVTWAVEPEVIVIHDYSDH